MNHSCRPNVLLSFNVASFSFQVPAAREIYSREQIFYQYTNILQPTAKRQKALKGCKFRCQCTSCTSTAVWDWYGESLSARVETLEKRSDAAKDIADKAESQSESRAVLEQATECLERMETEGLWTVDEFGRVLKLLGGISRFVDDDRSKEYARRSFLWTLA